MKSSHVFYLCLLLAIIFYALGVYSGYWFFIKWIHLGYFLLKITIWCLVIALMGLFGWIFFRKKGGENGE